MTFRIKNLSVEFHVRGGVINAVRDISLDLPHGKTLAIVGESGSGKSSAAYAVMGISDGIITNGQAKFDDTQFLDITSKHFHDLRLRRMAMIFQNPATSLNPTMPVGHQIVERKYPFFTKKARKLAIQLLEQVRISEPEKRVDYFPFQLSGGMQQRVMIALALANDPEILIADEPTTALDVTIQAQILDLLQDIQSQRQMSIIIITHDMGIVAKVADYVAIMYAGQIVESGPVAEVLHKPKHPYTLALKAAVPSFQKGKKLLSIKGHPPDLFDPPTGCGYFKRCPHAMNICNRQMTSLMPSSHNHYVRCFLQITHSKKNKKCL